MAGRVDDEQHLTIELLTKVELVAGPKLPHGVIEYIRATGASCTQR